MKKFIFGVLFGIFLPFLAGYFFLSTGGLKMGARATPFPLEKRIAHFALRASMKDEISTLAPIPANPENLLAGARVYKNQCIFCHGGLNEPEAPADAPVTFPAAPFLLPLHKGVTNNPVGATYWKVKNGIRFSGMPSFESALSDKEIWQVTLMLHEASHLPAEAQDVLKTTPAPEAKK